MRQVLCPVPLGRDDEISHLQAALAAAQDELITYCTIGGRASTAWSTS